MKSKPVPVKIQIPEPCSQSWAEMTPEAGGRHCAACAKTVTDFTRMTDAQILEVLRNSAGSCGRFTADQLGRELIVPTTEKRFSIVPFYKMVASLLLVFSAGKAVAQEKKVVIHQTDSVALKLKNAQTHLMGDTTYGRSTNLQTTDEKGAAEVRGLIFMDRIEKGMVVIDKPVQIANRRRRWWQFWKPKYWYEK